MSLTIVKLPVIPAINSEKDMKTAFDLIRTWVNSMNANGGVISVQDLLNVGLVKNVNGKLVKK